MSKAVANLTQLNETITFSAQDNGESISVKINELARGPAGPNSVTSATTSDGTANLSLSNVTTATAEVTGLLTADHIHGNLAGSVYAHVRAGEALAKGDPVYISGSQGIGANLIAIVSKADASDSLKMPAVGIMRSALANNASGNMVITGTITGINTAAYPVNGELYVAEGGGLTATPPNAYAQPVARVERSNTNNGAIIVKVNGLSAYSNTGNTLVRRSASGDATFSALQFPSESIGTTELGVNNDGSLESSPSIVLPGASGTLALTDNLSGVVGIAYGGTNATTVSEARTALGSGATGDNLFVAASVQEARLALGIQSKTGTSTGLAVVGTTDITGLTGYSLEADTWYKLELQYLWTSASSNFQINFVTTGTFLRGGTTPALGQANSAVAVLSTAVFVNDTSFQLRGSIGENRTNLPAQGYAYFKTGTAGTGKLQLQLLAGTTLSTITSSCAVLTKQN